MSSSRNAGNTAALDSFWQDGSSSLALRYPLTPILEDDYSGSDDCDNNDVTECDEYEDVTECDAFYHNDADDEEEDENVTVTRCQCYKHLFFLFTTIYKCFCKIEKGTIEIYKTKY